jgi:two-component system response regulator VicR
MSKKILVIDDDEDILNIIEIVLKDEGYQVIISRVGNFVNEIFEIQPDLILLDNRLAGTSGHDLCKTLKSEQLTSNIPVVMISAANGLKQIAIDCGADNYIEKRFDIGYLCEVVASTLSNGSA